MPMLSTWCITKKIDRSDNNFYLSEIRCCFHNLHIFCSALVCELQSFISRLSAFGGSLFWGFRWIMMLINVSVARVMIGTLS